METKKQIWQILTQGEYGESTLQSWTDDRVEAEKTLIECKEMWEGKEFWIEEGDDYIYTKCRGCNTVWATERYDRYNISTGNWCQECYDSAKYPYRKDFYFDPGYAGERLEEDY